MTILGISGSLRRDSYNSALLRNVPLELELWEELIQCPACIHNVLYNNDMPVNQVNIEPDRSNDVAR